MSTPIPFDTYEQRLIDNNVIKPKGIKIGFVKQRLEASQGSATGKMQSSRIDSINRKVDYHIEQDSNELVIKIRDKETGKIIKQIPEEEFLRLTNRISDFNKSLLDQTV